MKAMSASWIILKTEISWKSCRSSLWLVLGVGICHPSLRVSHVDLSMWKKRLVSTSFDWCCVHRLSTSMGFSCEVQTSCLGQRRVSGCSSTPMYLSYSLPTEEVRCFAQTNLRATPAVHLSRVRCSTALYCGHLRYQPIAGDMFASAEVLDMVRDHARCSMVRAIRQAIPGRRCLENTFVFGRPPWVSSVLFFFDHGRLFRKCLAQGCTMITTPRFGFSSRRVENRVYRGGKGEGADSSPRGGGGTCDGGALALPDEDPLPGIFREKGAGVGVLREGDRSGGSRPWIHGERGWRSPQGIPTIIVSGGGDPEGGTGGGLFHTECDGFEAKASDSTMRTVFSVLTPHHTAILRRLTTESGYFCP